MHSSVPAGRAKPLKIVLRRPRAALAGPSAGVRPAGRATFARAALLAAALACCGATVPALAQSSGERGAPAPSAKAVADALTYSDFQGECSQTAFVVNAIGNLQVAGGPVSGEGSTTLNGLPYDTYTLDLKTGPATFTTKFERVFTPNLPSSNYEMVFTTRVMLGNALQGESTTTIRCTNGVVFARNRANPASPIAVPVGGLSAWLALAALLAAAAAQHRRRGA